MAPLPTGVTFTDNGNGTATLAGTPASGSNSSYPITIGATNGFGAAGQPELRAGCQRPRTGTGLHHRLGAHLGHCGRRKRATATISTTATSGQQSVALSSTGAPPGALVSFSPVRRSTSGRARP